MGLDMHLTKKFYVEDLKLTKRILTEALAEEDGEFGDFYYHASW